MMFPLDYVPTDIKDRIQLHYYLKDHLGNIMVTFHDWNYDGTIDILATGNSSEVLGRQHYYSFGMQWANSWEGTEASGYWQQRFRYNGKEMHKRSRLLDYGFRYYSAEIGRFTGVDPLTDKMPEYSPYSYTFNNPLRFIDPDGRCPHCIIGFVIGFTLDVASQMVFEGKSLNDVNYGSAGIAGVAGSISGGISSLTKLGKVGSLAVNATIDAGESVGKQVISGNEVSGSQVVSDVIMGGIGGQAKVFDNSNIKVKENTLDRTQRIAKNDPASAGRAQNVKNAQNDLNNCNNINNATGTAAGNTLQTGSDKVRSFIDTGESKGNYDPPKGQMPRDNTRMMIPINVPKN